MSTADKHCMPQASTVEIDEKLNVLAPDLFQSNDILNNTVKASKFLFPFEKYYSSTSSPSGPINYKIITHSFNPL